MRLVPVPLGDFSVSPDFGDPPPIDLVSIGFRGTLYLLKGFGNLYSLGSAPSMAWWAELIFSLTNICSLYHKQISVSRRILSSSYFIRYLGPQADGVREWK